MPVWKVRYLYRGRYAVLEIPAMTQSDAEKAVRSRVAAKIISVKPVLA